MGEAMSLSKSGIPYLTHTWSPVVGCNRGCDYCWARRLAKRFKCELCRQFLPHVHNERWRQVTSTQAPAVVGVGFMAELFQDESTTVFRDAASHVPVMRTTDLVVLLRRKMILCPQHTYVTPTRCPENIPEGFNPPDNWWLLVTCTTQAEVDERLPVALERWPSGRVILNLEPLVEPAVPYFSDLGHCAGVILGGMSGPLAKDFPLNPDWVRSVRDQCRLTSTPFYFKQPAGRPGDWEGGCDEYGTPMLDGRFELGLPAAWLEILKTQKPQWQLEQT